MIIVRCANGVVLWEVRQTSPLGRALHCVQDGTTLAYTAGADVTQEQALISAATHSVALRGAIVQVVQLDLD